MARPGSGHEALLNLIPGARREILEMLKRSGPLPVEAVAEKLGITPSGARQHLTGLERDGVVTYEPLREGPGRPRHMYELTGLGDALFSLRHASVSHEALAFVRERQPSVLTEAFADRARRRIEEVDAEVGRSGTFEERLRSVCRRLEEEGYMPRLERLDDGAYGIVVGNCPVETLPGRFEGTCAAELAYLREALPDSEVERTAHARDGSRFCAYRVRPLASEQRRGPGVHERS